MHRDLNAQVMVAGERICLDYAFVFAAREALKLDIPVVFDSPYAILHRTLSKGICNLLGAQLYQQILLDYECEFLEEETPSMSLRIRKIIRTLWNIRWNSKFQIFFGSDSAEEIGVRKMTRKD